LGTFCFNWKLALVVSRINLSLDEGMIVLCPYLIKLMISPSYWFQDYVFLTQRYAEVGAEVRREGLSRCEAFFYCFSRVQQGRIGVSVRDSQPIYSSKSAQAGLVSRGVWRCRLASSVMVSNHRPF